MIRLRLLGGPRLEPARAERLLERPKTLALLCYLADRHQYVSRVTLLGMFWPDLDEEHARAALRKSVFLIRRQIDREVVVNQGDGIAVSGEHVGCDTVDFREAIRAGDRERALGLYEGELLAGFYVNHAADFERWVDAERSNLHMAAERAALELGQEALSAGDFEATLRWGRKAGELSPTSSQATFLVMMAHHEQGSHSRALDAYERHVRQLGADYGVGPSGALAELASRIRSTARRRPGDAAAAVEWNAAGGEEPRGVEDGGAERYRRLVETACDLMYETDPRGCFRWTNPAITRVLGYSPEEVVGRPYLNLVREDYRDVTLAFYLRQMQDRNPSTYFEFPALRMEGREVWLGQHAQLLMVDGKIAGFQAVARDVTTQVKVAEAQRNLALRDHETDLYSTRGFYALAEDRIKLARRTNHKLFLLSAHASGLDESAVGRDLNTLAGLLESTFRLSDVVSRVGERHFAVLALEPLDRDEIRWLGAVSARLRTAAREQEVPPRLTLSLSVAFAGTAENCTADRLLSSCIASGSVDNLRPAQAAAEDVQAAGIASQPISSPDVQTSPSRLRYVATGRSVIVSTRIQPA